MAERITITIETGNSAFDDQPATEVARILFEIATSIQDGITDAIPVMDINGITVGAVKIQRMRN
jgi:hypothetical protein